MSEKSCQFELYSLYKMGQDFLDNGMSRLFCLRSPKSVLCTECPRSLKMGQDFLDT